MLLVQSQGRIRALAPTAPIVEEPDQPLASRPRFAVYVVVACLTSLLQLGFFDCSGERLLSFVGGALTVFAALAVIDRVYVVSVSKRSGRARLALSLAIAAVGITAVWTLASFTWITHLCG